MASPTVTAVDVAIVCRTVFEVDAFYAQCLECEWRCHARPHDDKSTAVGCAQRHGKCCPGHQGVARTR
jgi:hypothetical protein